MTSASGCRSDTWRAFSAASIAAQAVAVCPVSHAAFLIRVSSIFAGWIEKAIPAALSSLARATLAEARMIGSAIAALAPDQQLVDRRGGLLDRAAGDIDNRPMMLRKDTPRLADLGAHRLDIRVIRALIMIEHAEPVAAEMDQPFGIVGQSDDQRLLRGEQLGWQCDAGNEGHIRCLDPAIGEIETGRRFRGPRYADETDIGIVDAPARLPVIVVDRKRHRIDPREIFIVEQMLPARDAVALPAEI